MSKPRQTQLKGVPTYVGPESPHDNTTEPEQKNLVAGPGAGAAMLARPQVARLTADAKEFQPSTSRIVGDNVTGMPQGGYAMQDTPVDLGADMATGGEPDGPKSANRPGPQNSHRGVTDWPEEKGSGSGLNLQSPDNV